ncbi:MAG: hypothetical protein WDN50_09155 [Bradyrhizobium sp.]
MNLIQDIINWLRSHPVIPGGTRGAPGPEIGDGLVGIAIATVVVLTFVIYPRVKQWRQSKQS